MTSQAQAGNSVKTANGKINEGSYVWIHGDFATAVYPSPGWITWLKMMGCKIGTAVNNAEKGEAVIIKL